MNRAKTTVGESKIGVTRKNKSLSKKAVKVQKTSRKINRQKRRHKKTRTEKKSR